MKNNITVKTHLSSSHEEDNDHLKKILSGRLRRLGREKLYVNFDKPFYWNADYYFLNRSKLFLQATAEIQEDILLKCSNQLLQEAYFIEKSGLSYCAKMILLAENTEIAQAYSLIGADEATHLQWVTPYIPKEQRSLPPSGFLSFLTKLIEEGEPNCLVYLLQVILEGWGLYHYRNLALSCTHVDLKLIFSEIVRDEALHHQTGMTLYQPEALNLTQYQFVEECLAYFLEMIRLGPQAVVMSMDEGLGGMNKQEKIVLFDELSGPKQAKQKLQQLKLLMSLPGCEKMIAKLDEKKLFEPYLPKHCVS